MIDSVAPLEQSEVLIFSSGTTGNPKALLHSVSSLITTARASSISWPKECCVGLCLSLSRIAGLVQLMRGLIEPDREIAFVYQVEELMDFNVSHLAAVPAQLSIWASTHGNDMQRLRAQLDELLLGGSSLSDAQRACLMGDGWPFRMTFGMTETAATIALTDKGVDRPYRALPHCTIKALDDGRLAVATPTVALGRMLDDGSLVPLTESRWLTTEDVVEVNQNQFIWRHRADRVINSGGIKLSCDLLEQRLGQLGVEQAWVFPTPNALWGERPSAFVLSQIDVASLQDQMLARWGKLESCDAIKLAPKAWLGRAKIPLHELQSAWEQH